MAKSKSEHVYVVQYEVRPGRDSTRFHDVGGAFVHCFIRAASKESAGRIAYDALTDEGWELLSVENGPVIAERQHYEDDAEELAYFDEAADEGACYVFHQWPPDVQDDDVVN